MFVEFAKIKKKSDMDVFFRFDRDEKGDVC
jgi:hypothetical protein